MRGRLALQSTSCEMLKNVIPFRESSPQDESVRLADFRSANASPRRFCFSRRCLSARGQRRAQMPNFVFHIVRIPFLLLVRSDLLRAYKQFLGIRPVADWI